MRPPDISTSDEYATFKRVYETPILLARAPDASPRTREQGEVRVEQVSAGEWREILHSCYFSSCKQLRGVSYYGAKQLYWAITFHRSVRQTRILVL